MGSAPIKTTAVRLIERRLGALVYAQKHRLVLGLICSGAAAALGAAYAYLSGPLLQTLLSGGQHGTTAFRALVPGALQSAWTALGGLGGVAVVLVVLAAVKGLLNLLQTVLLEGASQRMGHGLRRSVYGQMLAQPLAVHRRFAVGDLLARLMDDTRLLQQALIEAPLALVRELIAAAFLLAVAIYLAPVLALIAALALPLIGVVVGRLSKRVRSAAGHAQSSLGHLAARAQQALAGLREVKACGAIGREISQLSGFSDEVARWGARRAVLRALSPLVNEVAAAAAIGVTICYAGVLVARQVIGPAELVSFFAAVLLLYRPVKGISNAIQLISASGASAARVAEVLVEPADAHAAVAVHGGDRCPTADRGCIAPLRDRVQLERVCFRYRGGAPLLDQFSLTIAVGEIVALTGRSGSGKSTVIDLLCGLERAESGALKWDGRSLSASESRALPLHVGLVSQQPLLFDGTLAENARYGNPEASDEQLWVALDEAGLRAEVDAMPGGLETVLGSGGRGLSVGQAQRLVIARALLRGTRLVLLDEPASALDASGVAQLESTLRRLRRNRAVLLVSHRPQLIHCADRVVRLVGGRVHPESEPGAWRGDAVGEARAG